ncbi:class I adenylate-forming enzyme family protein [Psychrobacillus sp. L3]|uniref:class I adenylate-forming enzyme family protein n=1 Tax=Psychrobacillus sp. L3 TaxID=3236891 RepID=UPI0036F3289D
MYTEQTWIYKRAALSPKKIALIDSQTGEQWSYQTLTDQISKWVHYFHQQQFQKGDRIVVLSQNRIELFAIIFACGIMGLLYVPLNFRLSELELLYMIEDCQPVLVIHDEDHLEVSSKFIKVSQLLITDMNVNDAESSPPYSNWSPTDPWLIIYTGGTTGKPKGVVLSFDSVNWNAINTIISWGLNETDCTLNYMPMFHTGGINALCLPVLMAGGTVVTGSRFHPEEALKALNIYKTTMSLFVPTMYQAMLDTDYMKTATFPTVKVFLSGGAPCPKTIYNEFEEKGILFKEGYGLTEAGPNNFFILPEKARIKKGSVGKCMQFNEVKVINELGEICHANEIGELHIAGKHVFTKYWNNENESSQTLVNGWLKTGDLAKRDEEGDYFIVGRKKEIIISGGENVYPQEVERCLLLHPNIREAAVIGVADVKWGECITAFITCKEPNVFDESEIITHCRKSLGGFKVPKKIFVLAELPRTDIGKIDKKRLVQLAVE